MDPRILHIKTRENLVDMRAWHISCVEVKAPRNEIAIDATMSKVFHLEPSWRNPSWLEAMINFSLRQSFGRVAVGRCN